MRNYLRKRVLTHHANILVAYEFQFQFQKVQFKVRALLAERNVNLCFNSKRYNSKQFDLICQFVLTVDIYSRATHRIHGRSQKAPPKHKLSFLDNFKKCKKN
ncbi:MAG: hypothetical protein D6714_02100 [Bacteroidetes bacterium]|nr:MAG: hypothetical protein D6714_02100 [Bacteroidota bacterium]